MSEEIQNQEEKVVQEKQFTKCWQKLIIGNTVVSIVALLLSLIFPIIMLVTYVSNPNLKYAKVVISKKYDKGQTLSIALEPKKDTVALFYADWCGYCKRFAPQFHKVTSSKEFKKDFAVAYINCEAPENTDVVKEYGIKGFPTVYLIEADGDKKQLKVGDFYNEGFIDSLK